MTDVDIDIGKYSLGWSDPEKNVFKPEKGLNEDIIRKMSEIKEEPEWMLDFRLKAYKRFLDKPMPEWVAKEKLNKLDFDDIYYYIKPTENQADTWDEVPEEIKQTYEKLGIPEAERSYLAGVTAQYESEVVYHKNREDLEKLGVLFCDMDTAVREYPELVKEYFGTVIPPGDNKFSIHSFSNNLPFIYGCRCIIINFIFNSVFYKLTQINVISKFNKCLIIGIF